MADDFFDHPILNSPYTYPKRHWALDETGQPTGEVIEDRRRASFITPIPKPKKSKSKDSGKQVDMVFDEGEGLSTEEQQYVVNENINELRQQVEKWRGLARSQWGVTPETARLLEHWRHHGFSGVRPFFCQIEAAETVIWLTEVAPQLKAGQGFREYLANASAASNPGLQRLALKLATGAGKTTVMAMLIAWQTVNAVRHPGSKQFTRGFLIVTPGLTIKDRLRVLQPNDPENYYSNREIVPGYLLGEVERAKIVITNYHAFRLRQRFEVSAGGRALLKGRHGGEDLHTAETEGQMLQRVMSELMGMKRIFVLNDEAHHCYRDKPPSDDEERLKGDDLREAERNTEAARLWVSGLEMVQRNLGINHIVDLSATPFFLAGSGYQEGTLFPWTMSDFSLVDAIECGIVKLPRVPVDENIPGNEMPLFRDLWRHIGKDMPRKGRGGSGRLDPQKLPTKLITAIDALYGNYEKTFRAWESAGLRNPPCFIVVCQNTAISKLVFDYIAGYFRPEEDEQPGSFVTGRLQLFQNFDPKTGAAIGRPKTLLVDSEQLEAGDALDPGFRVLAEDEIARFRRDLVERTGDPRAGDNITDQQLLREVMNTVGKVGQLGADVRCVVSVSMLTEGWDANNVTHILGIRAFGTQLLCEQVVGRALRRQSYELNEEGLFDTEYADIFGVPFDFTAKPVISKPKPPAETVLVHAVRPERDGLEITFPRVEGYRVEVPRERLTASFNAESKLELSPALVGPSITRNAGIIGASESMTLEHLRDTRMSTIVYTIAQRLLETKWRDANETPESYLFGDLRRITKQWLDECLVCRDGTFPAQLRYPDLADLAANKITAAITRSMVGKADIKAVLDPYNPSGSTAHVRFTTSRATRWETLGPPPKNHVNWVIWDSTWEREFCRVAEAHPKVIAYTKNHSLGFEVPYRLGSKARRYIPDFIVLVDDGRGAADPLRVVVEVKGYRGEDAKEKKATMDTYWVPGVNNLRTFGRWAFIELTQLSELEPDFSAGVNRDFGSGIVAALAMARK